jgi:hypothetical protein
MLVARSLLARGASFSWSPSEADPTCFLSLPREIRDEIYRLVLVKPSPIAVWAVQPKRAPQRVHCLRPEEWLGYDNEAMSLSHHGLTPTIMRTHRTIGIESSVIFYGENTFSFEGDHNWLPVLSWLDRIGPFNRNFLRNVETTVQRPSQVWQRADGTRTRWISHEDDCFPRNSSLAFPISTPLLEGLVDNINPAIETVMFVLGSTGSSYFRTDPPTLVFTLKVAFNRIPGVTFALDAPLTGLSRPLGEWFRDRHWELRFMSMDMPNLIEKWRAEYSSSANGLRRVEVRWIVETEAIRLDEKRVGLEEQGWDIVSEEPAETMDVTCLVEGDTRFRTSYDDQPLPRPTVKFVLRRRELTGPVIGSEPCPYQAPEHRRSYEAFLEAERKRRARLAASVIAAPPIEES